MIKGNTLTGKKGTYTILNDFEVTGGMSKVSFARLEKDGNTYFIKEFLSPKLSNAGSPATVKKKRKKCDEFESHHNRINKEIAKKSAIGGNLISAFDFFRNGTTYYKVCEKVDISNLSISAVSKLPTHQRLLIIRTIVSSLKILHDIGIVHGDLKPDNILIKKISDKKYVAKLIDFDESYFSSAPPNNPEEVIGTQEYYSPELGKYISRSDDVNPTDLTTASDIFALGVLFAEYWGGEKFSTEEKYRYAWQQVLDGKKIIHNKKIPIVLQDIIDKMLSINPKNRPNLSEIISFFRSHADDKVYEVADTPRPAKAPTTEPPKKPKPHTGGILKGKLLRKSKEVKTDEPKLKGKLLKP